MAKPNYAFAKRQRDLAQKQKKEEKRKRKAELLVDPAAADPSQPTVEDASQSESSSAVAGTTDPSATP